MGKQNTTIRVFGKNWHLYVTRNMSFWHQSLCTPGYYWKRKEWGLTVPFEALSITERGTLTSVFYHEENWKKVTSEIVDLFSSLRSIAQLKNRYHSHAQTLLACTEICSQNATPKNWELFCDAYATFTAGLNITVVMGRLGLDKLISQLRECGVIDEKIPSVVALITYPRAHTPLFNSRKDLLAIGADIQSRKITTLAAQKRLRGWLSKYGSIPVNFCDDPWTFDDACKQLQEISVRSCNAQLQSLEKSHLSTIHNQQKVLAALANKRIRILAYALGEATSLNEYRKNIFSIASLGIRPVFSHIALRAGRSDWRDCFYLTEWEIRSILKGEKIPVSKLVKTREVAGLYVDSLGNSKIISPSTTRRIQLFVHSIHCAKETGSGQESVSGFSANGGVVRGVARVILGTRDFGKMQDGDILVTTMTSVDFVPVMQRAAAFVTNEGGITSHASIVAREMKKPCVIGTKIATQIFKDGDRIEVDAEKGIVRKL